MKNNPTMKSEVGNYGYFVRQKNAFTKGFGPGENPVEAKRYHLVWAEICQWSNRASIVIDLLGLEDVITKNLAKKDKEDENNSWQFVYDKDRIDPVLGIRYLNEAYYKADPDYAGRGTVPALVDVQTKEVVNNDYHRLTNYFEVDFKDYHKPGAPDLYPEDLRDEIDQANVWLFENVNNATYRATFARAKEPYWEAYHIFYGSLDLLEEHLATKRFLFGDYITDSDVRLYCTLSRLDSRYTWHNGHSKQRLVDYENLWAYMRELYAEPAFKNNTYFKGFSMPTSEETPSIYKTFNERFLEDYDFEKLWSQPVDRSHLSADPDHKFRQGGQ